MWIDTDMIVGITEASTNLYSAFKIADQYGMAVIMKNNKPVYAVFTPTILSKIMVEVKKRIPIREATRSFSATAIQIYEFGCILITKRNQPAYAMFDYHLVDCFTLEDMSFLLKEV